MKEFADDNFKSDENRILKKVRKHCGKGEIARFEQFLPFSTVFSKDLNCRHVKSWTCLGKD